jgi:hypothetical protein
MERQSTSARWRHLGLPLETCLAPLLCCPGADAVPRAQPYLMVTIMFVGMAFCLPLSYLEEWRNRRRAAALAADGATKPLLESLPMEARPMTCISHGTAALAIVFACSAVVASTQAHARSSLRTAHRGSLCGAGTQAQQRVARGSDPRGPHRVRPSRHSADECGPALRDSQRISDGATPVEANPVSPRSAAGKRWQRSSTS